jgi:DNA-binding FadR family transcriptional regulator
MLTPTLPQIMAFCWRDLHGKHRAIAGRLQILLVTQRLGRNPGASKSFAMSQRFHGHHDRSERRELLSAPRHEENAQAVRLLNMGSRPQYGTTTASRKNMLRHDGRNLTFCIVDSLGRAIISGTYSAACPLPVEADLAKQYGVSRTLIREAVKMITAKGLVGAYPRQGVFVKAEQEWDLLDPDVLHWLLDRGMSYPLSRELAQLRLAVEPKAAAQAAQMATKRQKANLRATLGRIAASERGEDDGLAAQIAFHEGILRASGNRFYARVDAVTEASLRLSARLPLNHEMTPQLQDYMNICGAILVGDSKAAEAAMQALIQAMLDRIDDAERKARAKSEQAGIRPPMVLNEQPRSAVL